MNEFEERKLSEETLVLISNNLKDKGISLDIDGYEDEDDISSDLLLKFLKYPVPFIINDDGELTVKIDGEEHILDPKRDNAKDVAEQESQMVRQLPRMPWDIYCQGLKRKQQEVTAAYKVVVVNAALGNLYEKRLNNVIKDYDFVNLRSLNNGGETFSSLLQLIEQDAGSVTKFLLSCCSIQISSKKQKGERAYTGILPEEDATWVENVSDLISAVETDVSKKLEFEPSRLKRLEIIQDKDNTIKSIISREVSDDARKQLILKISKLTTDNVPQREKTAIKEAARREVGKLFDDGVISDSDVYSKLLQKISRRAVRLALRNFQKKQYNLLMDPSQDLSKLLPKT